ncbi:hypothetical protein Bbelb_347920 [Branchiostoma belcheri]|nr:hypothetical protein Bbelb_347920 [Branchiostoma belcheri]
MGQSTEEDQSDWSEALENPGQRRTPGPNLPDYKVPRGGRSLETDAIVGILVGMFILIAIIAWTVHICSKKKSEPKVVVVQTIMSSITTPDNRGLTVIVLLDRSSQPGALSAVQGFCCVEEKANTFYSLTRALFNQHLPVKVTSVRACDKNWVTERVQRVIRSRTAEFKRHGRSVKNLIQYLKQENEQKWWNFVNLADRRATLIARMTWASTFPGAEAWTLTATEERHLDTFDQKCLRRILGYRWYDFVSNSTVRQRTGQPPVSHEVRQARLRLFGHLARADPPLEAASLLKAATPAGWSRPRGRPRRRWRDQLNADFSKVGLDAATAWQRAQDRTGWKTTWRGATLPGACAVQLCKTGEVKALLKSLNSTKASGPDDLPTWTLKQYAEDLAPVVTHLFNASYQQRITPSIWKSDTLDVGLSRSVSLKNACTDSVMTEEASQLDNWADRNDMLLNGNNSHLGFIFDNKLSWREHVKSMVSKASSRLHYLRLLTKQGMSVQDLVQVNLSLIRPVLEYGYVLLVGCSEEQAASMVRVQRRAGLSHAAGPSLKERREAAVVSLVKAMLNPEHPLHDLVPAQRQSATGRALRNGHNITVPYARTKRLQQSFLYFAIRLYNNSPSGS